MTQSERRPTDAARTSADVNSQRLSVLVVDDDDLIREVVAETLTASGYSVATAADGHEALERISEVIPFVVVCDVNMPGMNGFELLDQLRATAAGRSIPFVFLTARTGTDDIVRGLDSGADDYLVKPFDITELLARVRSKVERPPVPAELFPLDRSTGVLSLSRFIDEANREHSRAERSGREGGVARVTLVEIGTIRERFGAMAVETVVRQVAGLIASPADGLELVGRADDNALVVLFPERDAASIDARLRALGERVAGAGFEVGDSSVAVTPVSGWVRFDDSASGQDAVGRATVAADAAAAHLDLVPVRWESHFADAPASPRRHTALLAFAERARLPFQIALTFLAMIAVPFLVYWGLDEAGFDITEAMYVVVVVALLVTATAIWTEGFIALRQIHPPEDPVTPYPPASAIIVAYLPNEAATVMETIDAFLATDYPADVQIILAYNSPYDMPIEERFRELARHDPRFVVFRVDGSTSKAQNVNAALSIVNGEYVGLFDADHLPEPDGFRRAWRWLSDGWDIVQGHPVVRNGDVSWISRTVAVEFEGIYSVSHPGRQRLHDFGIFGGSNGYWRTELLRAIRMRGSMLTEDIDSALRVVEQGGRIVSDPHLLTRELSPTTLNALWNQRMRWAQGWFQVSLRHLWPAWRSKILTLRQKIGFTFLLGWREIFPWISVQMFPIIAYWIFRDGFRSLDWFIPLFVLTTIYTLSVGPGQVLFAYHLAADEIKQRRRWFVAYLIVSTIFYTEFKNLISRVAQIKELMRERSWKVTPR